MVEHSLGKGEVDGSSPFSSTIPFNVKTFQPLIISDWASTDILLSKTQYEKAKKEGEFFWLIVVEKVQSETEYGDVTLIVNPIQYFEKLQLDAGWKQFGEKL